jgi:hypothetical protein
LHNFQAIFTLKNQPHFQCKWKKNQILPGLMQQKF